MLLIIFGAGASYDSVPSKPPVPFTRNALPNRPPIADELFHEHFIDIGRATAFPQCLPIIPHLQLRHGGKSVERVLEELKEEANSFRKGGQQIGAIRYYLHFMLSECERLWKAEVVKGISNYITLLDHVERWTRPAERICIVTFNYDTLIEDALETVGVRIKDVDAYITHLRYSLIKLHGSVNWGHRVIAPPFNPEDNAWQIANKLIDASADLRLSGETFLVSTLPIANPNGMIMIPAIAIPVETKKNYECPRPHLSC